MVITESKCVTNAIPAASVVSLPYPAGITIAFKPIGIHITQNAQVNNASLKNLPLGINITETRNNSGNTSNLIAAII